MELGGAQKKAYKEAYEKWKKLYEKAKRHPKFWIGFGILLAVILLIWLPPWRVSHFEINNDTKEADLENQYRATLAQIIGGFAILFGLYFTWGNLINAREGQITERFTKAVDQLGKNDKEGKPAIEIRLGGIYSLERISKESEEDYWPIMEILTAYVRKNSSFDNQFKENFVTTKPISMDIRANESTTKEVQKIKKVSLDIQVILTVLGRRKNSFNDGESTRLNLRGTCLQEADLFGANLEGADLFEANLEGAYLKDAHFARAHLEGAHLTGAHLIGAYLTGAHLIGAYLTGARLIGAYLKDAHFARAHLTGADLTGADLTGADLFGADLTGANLTGANLTGANLLWARLTGAHLTGADLTGANLTGAYLLGAHLTGADLFGADLSRANFEGANFEGAFLLNAKNLTSAQLSKVKTLYDAKLDEDLREQLKNKDPDKYQALIKKPEN